MSHSKSKTKRGKKRAATDMSSEDRQMKKCGRELGPDSCDDGQAEGSDEDPDTSDGERARINGLGLPNHGIYSTSAGDREKKPLSKPDRRQPERAAAGKDKASAKPRSGSGAGGAAGKNNAAGGPSSAGGAGYPSGSRDPGEAGGPGGGDDRARVSGLEIAETVSTTANLVKLENAVFGATYPLNMQLQGTKSGKTATFAELQVIANSLQCSPEGYENLVGHGSNLICTKGEHAKCQCHANYGRLFAYDNATGESNDKDIWLVIMTREGQEGLQKSISFELGIADYYKKTHGHHEVAGNILLVARDRALESGSFCSCWKLRLSEMSTRFMYNEKINVVASLVAVPRKKGSDPYVDRNLVNFMTRQTKAMQEKTVQIAQLTTELRDSQDVIAKQTQMIEAYMSLTDFQDGQIKGQAFAAYTSRLASGENASDSRGASTPADTAELETTLQKQMQGQPLTDDEARVMVRHVTISMLNDDMAVVRNAFDFRSAIDSKQKADEEKVETERLATAEKTKQAELHKLAEETRALELATKEAAAQKRKKELDKIFDF